MSLRDEYLALDEIQQMRLRYSMAQRIISNAKLVPVVRAEMGPVAMVMTKAPVQPAIPPRITNETIAFVRQAVQASETELEEHSPEPSGNDEIVRRAPARRKYIDTDGEFVEADVHQRAKAAKRAAEAHALELAEARKQNARAIAAREARAEPRAHPRRKLRVLKWMGDPA